MLLFFAVLVIGVSTVFSATTAVKIDVAAAKADATAVKTAATAVNTVMTSNFQTYVTTVFAAVDETPITNILLLRQ